jgi:hypothetical protein
VLGLILAIDAAIGPEHQSIRGEGNGDEERGGESQVKFDAHAKPHGTGADEATSGGAKRPHGVQRVDDRPAEPPLNAHALSVLGDVGVGIERPIETQERREQEDGGRHPCSPYGERLER